MKSQTLHEVIGRLAGATSLCWQPRPDGVFDSQQAQKFVDEARQQIHDDLIGLLPENRELYKRLENYPDQWYSGFNFAVDHITKAISNYTGVHDE